MMAEWLKHVAIGRTRRNKKKDYRNGCLDSIFIILIIHAIGSRTPKWKRKMIRNLR
jgi:hypothetical protein